MVQSKSTSRLSSIVLTQTDTTVGFVSQSKENLYQVKSRNNDKPFIQVYSSLHCLFKYNHRIPSKQKNLLRRAKKTTFIVKNKAFRVAQSSLHSQFLRKLEWNYSTSANESGRNYNLEFCEDKADIIIEDKNGLHENSSSSLFIINNSKRVRIR